MKMMIASNILPVNILQGQAGMGNLTSRAG